MRTLFPAILAALLLLAGLAVAGDLADRCRVSDLELPTIVSPPQSTDVPQLTTPVKSEKVPNYEGRVRVYIVEPTSRYYDYNFYAYQNGFLDFVIDQSISIPFNDSLVLSQVWNGTSSGYGDVTEGNIAAVAAVSNNVGHAANADPDAGAAPFTAYYTDACAYAATGETAYDDTDNGYSHTVLVEEGTAHG